MKESLKKSPDVCSLYLGLAALGGVLVSPFGLLSKSGFFSAGLLIPFVTLAASAVGFLLAYRTKNKGAQTRRRFVSLIINGTALIFSIAACIFVGTLGTFVLSVLSVLLCSRPSAS